MKRTRGGYLFGIVSASCLLVGLLVGCEGPLDGRHPQGLGSSDDGGIPDGVIKVHSEVPALTYVGASTCQRCHRPKHAQWEKHGHPYGSIQVVGGKKPADGPFWKLPALPPLDRGKQYQWSDISWILGGGHWNARFVVLKGNMITGTQTSWILPSQTWTSFSPTAAELSFRYSCAPCHATGYSAKENPSMPGAEGSWLYGGVTCENSKCHGPGSQHVAVQSAPGTCFGCHSDKGRMPKHEKGCIECHSSEETIYQIEGRSGFMAHGGAADGVFLTKHHKLTCLDCHDPHLSAVQAWPQQGINPEKGIKKSCQVCHPAETKQKISKHSKVTCIDCHMPKMAKHGYGDATLWLGDGRTHVVKINPSASAPQTIAPANTMFYPYVGLGYACKRCHNAKSFASVQTDSTLEQVARGYHD